MFKTMKREGIKPHHVHVQCFDDVLKYLTDEYGEMDTGGEPFKDLYIDFGGAVHGGFENYEIELSNGTTVSFMPHQSVALTEMIERGIEDDRLEATRIFHWPDVATVMPQPLAEELLQLIKDKEHDIDNLDQYNMRLWEKAMEGI